MRAKVPNLGIAGGEVGFLGSISPHQELLSFISFVKISTTLGVVSPRPPPFAADLALVQLSSLFCLLIIYQEADPLIVFSPSTFYKNALDLRNHGTFN